MPHRTMKSNHYSLILLTTFTREIFKIVNRFIIWSNICNLQLSFFIHFKVIRYPFKWCLIAWRIVKQAKINKPRIIQTPSVTWRPNERITNPKLKLSRIVDHKSCFSSRTFVLTVPFDGRILLQRPNYVNQNIPEKERERERERGFKKSDSKKP